MRVMLRYIFATALLSSTAFAGPADVIDAQARQTAGQSWRISATIRHADTGWDHYANGFEVLAPDGTLLATRVLHHPHVNEQPFTRSVSVDIPKGVTYISVRAIDSVHGSGGAQVRVDLQGPSS